MCPLFFGKRLFGVPIGVFLIILTARLATLGVMAVGRVVVPNVPYENIWIVEDDHPFIDYLANFDGAWFIRVAALGYKKLEAGDYDLAEEKKRLRVMDERGYEEGKKSFGYRHFPLFPYVIRAVQKIVKDWTLSGLFIANFFSFLYIIYIFKLAELEFGEKAGWWAAAFVTCAPNAHYFLALYSEGMCMAFLMGSLYHARRGQWGWATLLGFLASATRFEGYFSPLGMFLILVDQSGGWKAVFKDRRLLCVITASLGVLCPFVEFWRISGSFIEPYVATTKALGYIIIWPWQAFAADFQNPNIVTFGVDIPAYLAMILLTILSARMLPRPLAILLLFMLPGGLVHPHMGCVRGLIVFFFFHLYFGELAARKPRLGTVLLIFFSMLLILFSILFINGYWI